MPTERETSIYARLQDAARRDDLPDDVSALLRELAERPSGCTSKRCLGEPEFVEQFGVNWVQCRICGATGVSAATQPEAGAYWNQDVRLFNAD